MRKKLVLVLAGVLALTITAVAYAVQSNQAIIKFSKTKRGGPTAISSRFIISDPGNPNPPGKPTVQIKQVDINFPRGMKFNDNALSQCKASVAGAITLQCKRAKLATGRTDIDFRGTNIAGGRIVTAGITAYNAKRGLKLVLDGPSPVGGTVLTPKLTRTSKLVTPIPRILGLVNAFLSDFRLNIPIKYGKVRGKRVPYAQLPKTCPKGGKWKVTTTFYLATGKKETTPGTVNRCTR